MDMLVYESSHQQNATYAPGHQHIGSIFEEQAAEGKNQGQLLVLVT